MTLVKCKFNKEEFLYEMTNEKVEVTFNDNFKKGTLENGTEIFYSDLYFFTDDDVRVLYLDIVNKCSYTIP